MSLSRGSGLQAALAIACVACVAAGWIGDPALLGVAAMAAIMLTLAHAWAGASRGPVLWSLVGLFVLFSGLLVWMAALDDPASELELWLGLPPATAVLVYAVWPLGVLPSLLYALRFHDTVLEESKLQRFLAKHSQRRS